MLKEATASGENEMQIRQLMENWAKAVRNRNMDGIMACHSEDIVMYDVPKPFQSVGVDAYRRTWDTFFAFTKPGVFDIQTLQIYADENIAFCFANMKCADKSSSEVYVDLDFRLTVGFEKINGRWVIVHEHHSVPAD